MEYLTRQQQEDRMFAMAERMVALEVAPVQLSEEAQMACALAAQWIRRNKRARVIKGLGFTMCALLAGHKVALSDGRRPRDVVQEVAQALGLRGVSGWAESMTPREVARELEGLAGVE